MHESTQNAAEVLDRRAATTVYRSEGRVDFVCPPRVYIRAVGLRSLTPSRSFRCGDHVAPARRRWSASDAAQRVHLFRPPARACAHVMLCGGGPLARSADCGGTRTWAVPSPPMSAGLRCSTPLLVLVACAAHGVSACACCLFCVRGYRVAPSVAQSSDEPVCVDIYLHPYELCTSLHKMLLRCQVALLAMASEVTRIRVLSSGAAGDGQ